jgi:hypothetical protein
MGTQIFITIYIPNSFIVNILSPREGKLLSNYLQGNYTGQPSTMKYLKNYDFLSVW